HRRRAELVEPQKYLFDLVHRLAPQVRRRQSGVRGRRRVVSDTRQRRQEKRTFEIEKLEVIAAGQQRLRRGNRIGEVEGVAPVDAAVPEIVDLESEIVHVEIEDRVAEADVAHEASCDLLLGQL